MSENSTARTAMIAGLFSVVGTIAAAIITGAFALMGKGTLLGFEPQANQPAPATPVSEASAWPSPKQPTQPVALPQTTSTQQPEYQFNFQAYQQAMKQSDFSDADREEIARQLKGRHVIWRGVVGQVNKVEQPTPESALIVVLHEDATTVNQVLFAAPAICSFPASAQTQLAALKTGDTVSVAGTYLDYWGRLGTKLVDCSLLDGG